MSNRIVINADLGRHTFGSESLPQINASASRDNDGRITLTVCNLDPHKWATPSATCEVASLATSVTVVTMSYQLLAIILSENPCFPDAQAFPRASGPNKIPPGYVRLYWQTVLCR